MKVQGAKSLPKVIVRPLGLQSGMTLDVPVEEDAVKLAPDASVSVREFNRMPEPSPVTLEWMLAEVERLGGIENAPEDDWDWGPDVGSEIIYDDYNPRPESLRTQRDLPGNLEPRFGTEDHDA